MLARALRTAPAAAGVQYGDGQGAALRARCRAPRSHLALFVATASAQRFRARQPLFRADPHPDAGQLRRLVQLLPDHVPARRLLYGDGGGWSVDYPRADINLSIRLSELTKTRISRQPDGEPNHLVMDLNDPAIFNCPFIMMTEVGAAYIGPTEAAHLREYLLKGGFLWADDFWGTDAWEHWAGELSKVLPPTSTRSSICRRDPSALPRPVRGRARDADPVDQRLGRSRRRRPSAAPTAPSRTRAASPTRTAA